MAASFKSQPFYIYKALLLRALDAIAVAGSFIVLYQVHGDYRPDMHGYAALLAGSIFLLCGNALGIYSSSYYKEGGSTLNNLLAAWFIAFTCLLLFAYITKTSAIFSRKIVTLWLFTVPVLLLANRVLLGIILARLFPKGAVKSIAIAGCGENSVRFMDNLYSNPDIGLQVAGIYRSSDDEECAISPDAAFLVKGDTDQLVNDARAGLYAEIYIAVSMREESEIRRLIQDLSDCSVPVYFIPDVLTINLMASHIYNLKGIPIVAVYDSPMDDFDRFIKRSEDVILSVIILAIVALPMLLIAILIKLTSGGPVFFIQRRYGLGGESIEVWKFRSMTASDNGDNVLQAKRNDPRVTPLGSFLRRTSLDELPQFFNVIKGDMSIVGPRPHAVAHNELYRKDIRGYMLRHLVKPGITGWAQVNGWRGETDTLEKMEKRIQYDLDYIQNWSLWLDLRIIGMTILGGFTGKNVY